MNMLMYFLRSLLIRAPAEFLVAILRLLFLLLLFLPVLVLRVWEWLQPLLRGRRLFSEEKEEPCGRLPESILRRPDPCIYSQFYLDAQGLPVTWNNPDIWVARADNPGAIEPDSYHLVDDTDYIVSVQVHNPGTDLALAVRVRLVYRPWSFNSPDVTPVETDAAGNEVFRFVNVMPMASTITQFKWHTPKLTPGLPSAHFCLQAMLFHPMDTNPGNNLGQENTQVYSASPASIKPGENFATTVPLFNRARRTQGFHFEATKYDINPEDRVKLQLKTTRGHARWRLSQRVANVIPLLSVREGQRPGLAASRIAPGRLEFQARPREVLAKTRYVGFEAYRQTLLGRDYSLPPSLTLLAGGLPLAESLQLDAREIRQVRFTGAVPADTQLGTRISLNLLARTAEGALAGGVTIILDVEEGP